MRFACIVPVPSTQTIVVSATHEKALSPVALTIWCITTNWSYLEYGLCYSEREVLLNTVLASVGCNGPAHKSLCFKKLLNVLKINLYHLNNGIWHETVGVMQQHFLRFLLYSLFICQELDCKLEACGCMFIISISYAH